MSSAPILLAAKAVAEIESNEAMPSEIRLAVRAGMRRDFVSCLIGFIEDVSIREIR